MECKVIKVERDFWYDDHGCDCCGSTRMDYFTSPELSYTPPSEEYVYLDLLEKYDPTWSSSDYYLTGSELPIDYVTGRLKSVGITVEFGEEIDEDKYPSYCEPYGAH